MAKMYKIYEINDILDNDKDLVKNELKNGFKIFNNKDKLITVFGSAREKQGSLLYEKCVDICMLVGNSGFSIITGGGPGMMEAACKGGTLAGVDTYGINIILPHEQDMNPYVSKPFYCNYLFTRKLMLIRYAKCFLIMPGGFGTLDELFEVLTLITVFALDPVPIILIGKDFWNNLYQWINDEVKSRYFINQNEIDLIKIIDTKDELLPIINKL